MKRFVIAAAFAVSALVSTAISAEGIGVIDMQQIFQNSPQVKKINDNLSKEFASRRDEIIKKGKALQDDINNYQKNQSVMSAKDQAALRDKINDAQNTVRQEQAKFQQDLFQAQNDKMNSFMEKLKNIVKTVAQEKKLTVVVPKNSVLYADDSLDVTNEVANKLK